MDTPSVINPNLEPRVILCMFYMESEQKHESNILDMALRQIGQTLPGFRVVSFAATQKRKPLRLKTFSERKWKGALALSERGELEIMGVFGCGGDEHISKEAGEFILSCWTRTKWEPWREESCYAKVRHISVEVRMLRESWRIADQIADNMKEVALFAAKKIELLQAYVSLHAVGEWDAEYLQRYKKTPFEQAETATDRVVAPAWFCIVQWLILDRVVDYAKLLASRFEVVSIGNDDRGWVRPKSIQLAPRITEVGASELREFRDLVL